MYKTVDSWLLKLYLSNGWALVESLSPNEHRIYLPKLIKGKANI